MKFELVGNGSCRSRCHVMGDPCLISRYYTDSYNYDECKLACESEQKCTGFAISDTTSYNPTKCTIYGNISSINVVNSTNSAVWNAAPIPSYGFKGFEVHSSDESRGTRCFKRLDEQIDNDGILSNFYLLSYMSNNCPLWFCNHS